MPPLTIPVAVLKRIAPSAMVFFAYHLAAEGLTESMTGASVGLGCGNPRLGTTRTSHRSAALHVDGGHTPSSWSSPHRCDG
jgi:hypothetical protein